MEKKLFVFDLDGTLAKIGGPVEEATLAALRELENRGHRIALCSGKPMFYLCGLLRQLQLKAPILLGENGAVMQIGIDLPPKEHYILPYPDSAKEALWQLQRRLEREMPWLWYQPNQVELTPFFREPEDGDRIAAILDRCRDQLTGVDIYRHIDCYDFIPKGISKAAGIRALGDYLGLTGTDMVAVGDGVNDYPMFAYAAASVGICLTDPTAVTCNVASIGEAMAYLLETYS